MVSVEGKNGRFYSVDTDRGFCECTSYQDRGKCPHSKVAMDLMRRSAKLYLYDIKQAFLVELRRGSIDVYNWARLISISQGEYYFKDFIFECFLTETRSHKTLEMIYRNMDTLSQGDLLELLIKSPKIHELPYFKGSYRALLESRSRYADLKYRGKKSKEEMLREMFSATETLEDAYLCAIFVEKNAGLREIYRKLVWQNTEMVFDGIVPAFLQHRDLNSDVQMRWLAEAYVGFKADPIPLDTPPFGRKPDFFIPSFKPEHKPLKELKESFEKGFDRIKPSRKIPLDLKVDLRYSDTYFGYVWRLKAFEQGLDPKRADWADVSFSKEDWAETYELDRHYYPSMYRNISVAS